ncbi:hypothetical protein J7E38_08235 [Bacillus sp. ISL-35]|uniref:hypothetical protein n=1 Tax=Bacillus sp. ISL-35 TaxID=2819122 RepID=UPI001BEB22F6|nr:hypothetical protein [Bacillus sp. ISL-35]MBT2678987.1 hypothetical protein [Bacillus sp. ISL-35]MBT2703984.1 hypothetical protein [Chryseobacterium sp. ISL-80]
MKKDKFVNIDANAQPANQGDLGEQLKTAEANMKLQDAFYDENKSDGVDPANLNNQSAILTEMD